MLCITFECGVALLIQRPADWSIRSEVRTLPCHGSNTGSTPVWTVALCVHIVHLLIITMQSAIDNIKATYDYETCKEIVDHGCESGVCSQHVYYGDTIKFFDTYESEINELITDIFGDEGVTDIWHENPCHIDGYKNNMTWTFIELVAMEVVDAKEELMLWDDKTIAGYNPGRSMTDSRYAQV